MKRLAKKESRQRERQMRNMRVNQQRSFEKNNPRRKKGFWEAFTEAIEPKEFRQRNQTHRGNSTAPTNGSPKTERRIDDSHLGEYVNYQPSNGTRNIPKQQSPHPAAEVKKPKMANNSSRGFQIVKDIFGKTRRNLQSKLNSSLIVNHKWTWILDDFVVGTILFKPGGDVLLIDPSGSASRGKWELEHALDAISLDFQGELTVMEYKLIDGQGAIMLLTTHGKTHLFVNDAKMDNRETIRTISAAMSWFNGSKS